MFVDRYAVTETCLAFTVFREDFNVTFVAMFTMLLFFKCFHWLAEDRVDYVSNIAIDRFIYRGTGSYTVVHIPTGMYLTRL